MSILHFKKALIVIPIFTLLLFSFLKSVSAAENDNSFRKEAINPGSFYYSFKRLWEKGLEVLQFGEQAQINYKKSLLKTRLAELNYVVDQKLLSELQSSTERVSYEAGVLTNKVLKQNKKENKGDLIKVFNQYDKYLPSLRDKFPANSSFWMLIQHDINSLKILSDQLK